MNKLIILSILLISLAGCKKETLADHSYTGGNNYMQILKVSYIGHTFTGGKTLVFNSANHAIDSVPVAMNYQPPGDFGNITFTHIPSSEVFFDASIIWMGTGHISYPQHFDSVSSFATINTPVACPDTNHIQILGPGTGTQLTPGSIDYAGIWSGISRLSVTASMVQQGCKVAFYPYTPSVGVGDPNEWSWIIFLYK